MMELKDLRFAYGEGEFTLRVKHLAISQGQRCCWIGPSGSGKTTLLHLIAGIFPPEKGRVTICGEEISALSDGGRRDFRIANIGLVFQDFALLDYLSVLDNILLPFRISRAMQLDATVKSRAARLASDVGLSELLSRRPTQLSQGERQRVAVCRAIIAHPKMVLADEPTANLDTVNAYRVLNALEDYATKHDATLVIVSHDREVMERFPETMDISNFCITTGTETTAGGDHGR